MSIAERVLDAVKAAVLLEARVTTLADHVGMLARDVRDIDKRLVRVETLIDVGMRNAASDPGRGSPPAIEDRTR